MFESTKKLRRLILDNPDLPLAIFATEEANNGEYYSMSTEVLSVKITELALYETEWESMFLERDDYEDKLRNDLRDEKEYAIMSDEEYDKLVKKKLSEAEFTKCIYVRVGN